MTPEIDKLIRPALSIKARRVALGALPLGASRFAGSPDMPEGLEWPANRYGEPLTFLAQVDLRKASGAEPLPDLPRDGWLLIFYDVQKGPSGHASDFKGWRVLHVSSDSRLIRRAPPPGARADLVVCSLSFRRQDTLPTLTTLQARRSVSKKLRAILDHERAAYVAARERLMRRASVHQLLGHPDEVQGPMDQGFASALVETRPLRGINPFTKEPLVIPGRTLKGVPKPVRALLRDAGPWRLLLQLDTDETGPGWMWGDAGRLYFWIREQDLNDRDFSRVWIAVQSS